MKDSCSSQFFRTTTGIQSGPDAFHESTFLMTFLTILGVTEILCSFKLVPEGKTGIADGDLPDGDFCLMGIWFA